MTFFFFFLLLQLNLFSKTLKDFFEEAFFPVSIKHVEQKEQMFRYAANQGQESIVDNYGLEAFYLKLVAEFHKGILDFLNSNDDRTPDSFLDDILIFIRKEYNKMILEEKQNPSFLFFLDSILEVALLTESFKDFCESLLFNLSRKRVDLIQAHEVHLFFILRMILDGDNHFLIQFPSDADSSQAHFESGLKELLKEKSLSFKENLIEILIAKLEEDYPVFDELDVWGRHQIFVIFLNLIEEMSEISESPEKLAETLMNETKSLLSDKQMVLEIDFLQRKKREFWIENMEEEEFSLSRILTVETQLQLQFDRELLEQVFNSDS